MTEKIYRRIHYRKCEKLLEKYLCAAKYQHRNIAYGKQCIQGVSCMESACQYHHRCSTAASAAENFTFTALIICLQ